MLKQKRILCRDLCVGRPSCLRFVSGNQGDVAHSAYTFHSGFSRVARTHARDIVTHRAVEAATFSPTKVTYTNL